MSILEILNIEDQNEYMSEDEIFTSRQSARHVCVAMKRYFEAHLGIKADQTRRSHVRNEGGSPLAETAPYKVSTSLVSSSWLLPSNIYMVVFGIRVVQKLRLHTSEVILYLSNDPHLIQYLISIMIHIELYFTTYCVKKK